MKSSSFFLVATHPGARHQVRHFTTSKTFTTRRRRCSLRIRAQQQQQQSSSSGDDEQSPEESNAENNIDNNKEPIRVEISNSVMRMFESGPGDSGIGLIELNQLKRRKKNIQQEAEKTREEEEEEQALNQFKQELFATHKLYVPKHDTLYPFLVATTAVLWDDDDDEVDELLGSESGYSEAVERFSSSFPRMKSFVEEDVERFKRKSSFLPSQLFCDLNGEPLNSSGDSKLEAWFLLSMYVKFKLWWKGPTSAAETALEYAYRISNFIFDPENELDRVFDQQLQVKKRAAIRYGRLLQGRLVNEGQPRKFLTSLQMELDKTQRGWTGFLMQPDDGDGDEAPDSDEVACLITHRSSLIFLNIPQDKALWISWFLLLWASATSFSAGVGQINSIAEQAIVPLVVLSVISSGTLARRSIASFHRISQRIITPQFVIPVPQLGAIPSFMYLSGCLPNRASLFDISAASSVACLSLSTLLMIVSWKAGFQASIVVNSDLFRYSAALDWIANRLSAEPDGLVLSPIALGGVLGLNFAMFGLLPVTISDGGRMLGAALGRPLLRSVSGFTFAFTTVSLMSKNLLLGFLWACTCAAMPEDSFQRDEVSDPGVVRKVAAVLLTAAALAAFVPVF